LDVNVHRFDAEIVKYITTRNLEHKTGQY
jgi:hypothetical protein